MIKVDPEKLGALVTKIFEGNGVPEEDSRTLSKVLLEANLSGRASHGVLLVRAYVNRLKDGGAKRAPEIRIIKETANTAVIDGDAGLGMVVADKAARICREKAEKEGMACVVVRNNNHFGASAYWNSLIGRDDMIVFSCCNVTPLMVPPGGKAPALGTNPICVYVPSETHGALCLDIATSMIAQGKMLDYRLKHQELEPGWAVDKDGMPTTDPDKAEYLTPFGGHKGYGLAVLVDIMSALLAGGVFGTDVPDQYHNSDVCNQISDCFIALKIDRLRDTGEFRQAVDSYIDYLHSVPAVEGQKIYFPGEIEQINKARCMDEGLLLPEDLVEQLKGFARDVGIEAPEKYFEL